MRRRIVLISLLACLWALGGCTNHRMEHSGAPLTPGSPRITGNPLTAPGVVLLDSSGAGGTLIRHTGPAKTGDVAIRYSCANDVAGAITVSVTGSDGYRWMRAGNDTCDGAGVRTIGMRLDRPDAKGLTVTITCPTDSSYAILVTQ